MHWQSETFPVLKIEKLLSERRRWCHHWKAPPVLLHLNFLGDFFIRPAGKAENSSCYCVKCRDWQGFQSRPRAWTENVSITQNRVRRCSRCSRGERKFHLKRVPVFHTRYNHSAKNNMKCRLSLCWRAAAREAGTDWGLPVIHLRLMTGFRLDLRSYFQFNQPWRFSFYIFPYSLVSFTVQRSDDGLLFFFPSVGRPSNSCFSFPPSQIWMT